jgi:8-oxo-dGTP diphosphatase
MARAPVLAAGGIVLRGDNSPRVAVVRLRKRNEWVLPKGKLNDGETPRAAAEREVLEETGHEVVVHEFLGTLVYELVTRSKVVHFWRMEVQDTPPRPLMKDVTAVEWLPLDTAISRLSRAHEKAFLSSVGPLALKSAEAARVQPHDGDTARPTRHEPAGETQVTLSDSTTERSGGRNWGQRFWTWLRVGDRE